ncbi:MAG: hypothetical protein B7Z51_04905 [Methyloversatilis sp. 12-65-5]|uniref:hypothetical protein n=1 Tax=Methyloversatilis sp. TaxID=2569862 RepID=UPI000BCCCAE1|nr:hypothetical protein [Methyloversatilis sp.]MBL8474469.1 hypothetical protein [Methyloversatilis sp.]OYW31675.1 MAG: hypothetical protein B7Z51_04905 [Methyloversatilis sp. 12-65-5]
MSKHQKSFQLTIHQIDLIEEAVRERIGILAHVVLASGDANCEESRANDDQIRELNELLGSLHNQKIFYSQVNRTGVPGG